MGKEQHSEAFLKAVKIYSLFAPTSTEVQCMQQALEDLGGYKETPKLKDRIAYLKETLVGISTIAS